MNKERVKNKARKIKSRAISYRLKCAKTTGNGLSHFVMYADTPKEKALL